MTIFKKKICETLQSNLVFNAKKRNEIACLSFINQFLLFILCLFTPEMPSCKVNRSALAFVIVNTICHNDGARAPRNCVLLNLARTWSLTEALLGHLKPFFRQLNRNALRWYFCYTGDKIRFDDWIRVICEVLTMKTKSMSILHPVHRHCYCLIWPCFHLSLLRHPRYSATSRA